VTAVVIAEAIAIALLAVLVAGLLRSHAEILRTLHEGGLGDPGRAGSSTGNAGSGPQDLPFGVQPGVALPRDNPTDGYDVAGLTPDGDATAIQVVGARENTLVAFLSSGCLTCGTFWNAFAKGISLPTGTRLLVITKGSEEESVSALRGLAPPGVPVVMSTDAWSTYSVPLSPYFVYVEGSTGAVRGEGAASSWEQVHNLMTQALDDQHASHRGAVRAGGEPQTGDGDFRETRADRELMAAGIFPGDPSLYPTQAPGDLPDEPGGTQHHRGSGR